MAVRGLKTLDSWDRDFESRWGIDIILFVVCRVRRGLCDKLLTRSEESHQVCVCVCVCVCLIVSDLETSRQPTPDLGCCARGGTH